jgi:poly-gamma-glutamate synthesis protein (capsule biosynthesis protein)
MKKWMLATILMAMGSQPALAQKRESIPPRQSLEFSDKCSPGSEVTISAVGDVLLHAPLQMQGFHSPQKFQSLWPSMIPIFQKFDVSYANFEGPSAEGMTGSGQKLNNNFQYDSRIYSSYPQFNYHPQLVQDLLHSGLDVVSTANNHALDRRQNGADMTIEAMREYGLRYTGTRPANNSANQGWHAITESNGFRIAWLACTFSTNGIPDRETQVLYCYQNRREVLNYVHALSLDPSISAVIVTPHWGNEYQHAPAPNEIEFGHQLIDAGALAVLATHPHVIQPWEKYVSSVSQKEGLIVYSSGNFVSGQFQKIDTQVGLMVALKLVQDARSRQLKIKTVRYLPLLMKNQPYRVEPVLDDTKVSTAFSNIWRGIYPASNRVGNLGEIFPNECP